MITLKCPKCQKKLPITDETITEYRKQLETAPIWKWEERGYQDWTEWATNCLLRETMENHNKATHYDQMWSELQVLYQKIENIYKSHGMYVDCNDEETFSEKAWGKTIEE